MKKQTIQIAITAIEQWRKGIQFEEGVMSSPMYFSDTSKALEELKKKLNK